MNNYSLLWFVGTLILPPVTEEIIFRGLILGYLRRAGAGFILANLIQAVCFGIYHQNLVQGIYAVVMGFLLGYLADRYESLLAPMLLHFLFNLFGTVLVELESTFIPQYGQVMLILQSIPLLVASLLLIQLRVGEKREKGSGGKKTMRFVIQRVTEAAVQIGGETAGEIGKGYLVLIWGVGFRHGGSGR